MHYIKAIYYYIKKLSIIYVSVLCAFWLQSLCLNIIFILVFPIVKVIYPTFHVCKNQISGYPLN